MHARAAREDPPRRADGLRENPTNIPAQALACAVLWQFLSATFDSLSRFEVFLLLAGVGLALAWNRLENWTRLAVLITLLMLAVLVLGGGTSRDHTDHIKVYFAAGAVGLALAWRSLPKQSATAALLVLTLLAVLNYMRWGPRYLEGQRVNSYDLLHYYMSARYFDEVGYYDLYPALTLADHEREKGPHSPKLRQVRLQRDGVYEVVPRSEALVRGREVRENFSDERWESFKHDVHYLQRKISKEHWLAMMIDRGFNGTPAFLFVAKPLAAICPVESIKWLCLIDVVLLGLVMWMVRWAYDTVTMLWCLLFMAVSLSLSWPVPGEAFLRYDYVCGLTAACCLLKKAKPGLAGIATGWATAMRLFPVMWLFGPAVKGVYELFDRRQPLRKRFNRRLLILAGATLATVAVLETGALISVGADTIKTHSQNISEHVKPDQLSSQRVGFAIATVYDGRRDERNISTERKQQIADEKTKRTGVALLILAVLGWGLRRRRDDEAFAFGLIPFFLLSTATYYYFVVRLPVILIHAQDLSKRRNQVGLAVLMALEVMSNYLEVKTGNRVIYVGYLSWGLTGYVVLMAAWLAWESFRGEDREAEPEPATEAAPTPEA